MTNTAIVKDGQRYVPVYVPTSELTEDLIDDLVAAALELTTSSLSYAAARTFTPTDALLPNGQRTGLTDSEWNSVLEVLPECGYSGLLLREYSNWQVTRTQATQLKATNWFSTHADEVLPVARKIDPANDRYGVFIVHKSCL